MSPFRVLGWSTHLIDDLKPGERVLDLRAVVRSAAILVGIIAAPIAARMGGLSWGLTAAGAAAAIVTGFILGTVVGRVVFPAPPGQAAIARWGRPSLGVALKASLCGGMPTAIGIALAATALGGFAAAGVSLAVGVVIAVAVGCSAALL